uniref:Major facilitator superfamily (MFS) profile domain-containing protein n=1 Tax=Ciona intestinalis TaxID=7719 RepID=F7ASU5_CIOIN
SLFTAVIETLCFSGIIYGWGSMSYMLEKEGFFNLFCRDFVGYANNTISSGLQGHAGVVCKEQEKMLTLVFTLSAFISALMFVWGYIFDKLGTSAFRFCGVSLYIAGWLLMAVTTRKESLAVFLAMIFVGISVFPVLMSNVPVSNLFPKNRVLMIAVLNGAFDSSALTFALMKISYDSGIAFCYIMYFAAVCGLLMVARFLFLMPRMHIPSTVPDGFQYGIQCCSNKQQVVTQEKVMLYEKLIDEAPKNTVSLKSCLLSVSFILNCFHLGVLQLRNQFFYGTIMPWLVQVGHGNRNETSSYLNSFGVIQLCGILVSPIGGILTDFRIKKLSRKFTVESATRKSVAIYTGLSSVIAILFSIMVLVPVLRLQYLSFLLQVVFRSFLYGGNAAFLLTTFPSEHFGKVYSITVTFGSIIALLQYPLFLAVTNIYGGDFTAINLALLVISVATIVHPIVLYRQFGKCETISRNIK